MSRISRVIALVLVVSCAAVLAPGRVLAFNGTTGNDYILIGCTDHGYGLKPYACIKTGASESFVVLGPTGGCSVTGNIDVWADAGHDWINVIGDDAVEECDGDESDWEPIQMGFSVMYVYGEEGDDTLWIDNQGIVVGHGGVGQDEVYATNAFAQYGDADEDRMEAQSNLDNDDTYGGADDDCLRDWSTEATMIHGGSGADVTYGDNECVDCYSIEVSWSGACFYWYPGWS